MRFPLQGAVLLETSHIPLDDSALACARLGSLDSRAPLARRVRFAAHIVSATGRNAPAPEASGRLSAQHELRSVSTDRRSLPKAVTRVVPQGPARVAKRCPSRGAIPVTVTRDARPCRLQAAVPAAGRRMRGASRQRLSLRERPGMRRRAACRQSVRTGWAREIREP